MVATLLYSKDREDPNRVMFKRGDRHDRGIACTRAVGLRARFSARSWADRLERGEVAPASVLWIFGRCIGRVDLPDLRRWLVSRAFAHWRQGHSLNRVTESPGKAQFFERAIRALGPASGEHVLDEIKALQVELKALHLGIAGRRSIHGPRRRMVPDPDLLLIDDVCNEILSNRRYTALARLIEWNALGFCITNVDLRWQLTAESAPRLRELAEWFAARAATHEATFVAPQIVSVLDEATGCEQRTGIPCVGPLVALVGLPKDRSAWNERHLDRLRDALAFLRLRDEGWLAPPFSVAASLQPKGTERLSPNQWFDGLHGVVEKARRRWRYWERVQRWRARRAAVGAP